MGFGFDLGAFAGSIVEGAFGANQADKNRDLQKYFARNAHQIEVEDLKKAGLNPVLSAGGGGASMPSGSTASTPDFSGGMSLSSGQDVSVKKATAQNLAEQNQNLKEQNKLIQAQTVKTVAEGMSSAQDARIMKARADFESELSPMERKASWIADQIGKVTGSAQDVKNITKKTPVQIQTGNKGRFR